MPPIASTGRGLAGVAEAVLRNEPKDADPRERLWADYAQQLAQGYLDLRAALDEIDGLVRDGTLGDIRRTARAALLPTSSFRGTA